MSDLSAQVVKINTPAEACSYIASRLKLARNLRKITLISLAAKLGITRTQLQNYETAQSTLSLARLWEIAQILDTDINFFVAGLSQNKNFVSNDDLNLLRLFHKVKDPQVKQLILNLLQEL